MGDVMINKEKVRYMTALAMFTKKNGKRVFKVEQFFGSDYIIWHMLLSFTRYTICAGVIAAVIALFRSDMLFYNINISGIADTIKEFFLYYIAGLIAYLIITAIVYGARYKKARRGMQVYGTALRKMARKFGLEEQED